MIPIAKPCLGEEEAAAAREVILSGWVTQGPKTKEFEDRFADYVGARHACAVSSCTTALHLALLGVNVQPGDVVITVSHSFIATANAIRYCWAEPVFVDIDPATYNMDPVELERCLSEDCFEDSGNLFYRNIDRISVGESPLCHHKNPKGKVAAILAVHQMGMPCDLNKIVDLANQYKVPVVEDAACAIGSKISSGGKNSWDSIGNPQGAVACFSFHPRKILTTGDGGMLTTNDSELDASFRLLRHHGMSIPDTIRHKSKEVVFEDYLRTGFNYRMTDIQAAIGIEQLKKVNGFVESRRKLAARYAQILVDMEKISTPIEPDFVRTNWQSYPIRISLGIDFNQKELMQSLQDKGIAVRRGIMNAHQEPPYQASNWSLPNSEFCRDESILLPLFSGMSDEEQHFVADTLKEVLGSLHR
jgi:dTDP-4-amino-4,6-dideoxygalactose transaminase